MDKYQSVLSSRYASDEMLQLFSDKTKFQTWRQLWVWLAESERECGLSIITEEHVKQLSDNVENIDFVLAREKEAQTRHDVMAHVLTYKQACPNAAGIIHLGATSAFVQDNTDLIVIKKALEFIIPKVALCIHRLTEFAEKHRSTPTLGRTHYQAASLTTIGKRATLWIQDLLFALKQLLLALEDLQFRGIKGATGSQDSFLKLFEGDKSKVSKLNELVTSKAGFKRSFYVTGQTYPRTQDLVFLGALNMLAAGIHKICMDIRMLQALHEIQEPFEKEQIGSSAMPYKKNPIRSERCCGLARHITSLYIECTQTAAVQGFERTLDDSSSRRIYIPESFLTADSILRTFQNIVEGLVVNKNVILNHVMEELPFLAMESILMALVKAGKDRQDCHEKIRQLTLMASEEKLATGQTPNLTELLRSDPFFSVVKDHLPNILDPEQYIGLCPSQVDEFIKVEVNPILETYKSSFGGKSLLRV